MLQRLVNLFLISVPKEILESMVKVRTHRLVDGDIITITNYIMDKNIKIIEDDEKILIVVYKKR